MGWLEVRGGAEWGLKTKRVGRERKGGRTTNNVPSYYGAIYKLFCKLGLKNVTYTMYHITVSTISRLRTSF